MNELKSATAATAHSFSTSASGWHAPRVGLRVIRVRVDVRARVGRRLRLLVLLQLEVELGQLVAQRLLGRVTVHRLRVVLDRLG